jgi:hypothetical protein
MSTEQNKVDQPYSGFVTQSRGGGCPQCGGSDGYLNLGRSHWESCSKHKTKWLIGENLFSCWRDETAEVWEKNAQLLEGYKEVRPIYPSPDQDLVDHRTPAEKEADALFFASLTYEPYDGPDILGRGCPKCGNADCYRFDGQSHWATCAQHRVKWRVRPHDIFGEDNSNSPTASNVEAWRQHALALESFLEVRPIYPPGPLSD